MTQTPKQSPTHSRILDRVEGLLFKRGRSSDRTASTRRAHANSRTALLLALKRAAVAACSAGFIAAFVFAVYFFPTTRTRIGEKPHVTDLTQAGLRAKVGFVPQESCTAMSQSCWTSPSYDDSTWLSARVPMKLTEDLRTVPGYERAPRSGVVVYRILVPVSSELLAQPDEISFSPVYVNHKYFAVYVNGRLSTTSSDRSSLGATTNVSLPRSDIKDGQVLVAIVGSLEEGAPGLASRASAYVGPKTTLDEIYVHVERAGRTFHLLFLLTKGGIFVVFALFFIFSRGQRGLYSFLVFSFFLTIENLFIGNFFDGDQMRLAVAIVAKIVATNALFAYLTDFYEVHRKRRLLRTIFLISSLLIGAMVLDHIWGSKTVTVDHLLNVTRGFFFGVIVVGLGAGAITYRMWKREGFAESSVKNLRNLWIFLALYLSLLIWEFGFSAYGGFDKRPLFDLLLFYYMAFITARDFGVKEGQVRTLEAHMIEKRRMEVELQEAAAIAKVFLPGSLPNWEALDIRSHHQSFTESSGDWYTFEHARTKHLHHFLMCDVTGHGVQAAIVVSACKSVLSLLIRNQPELLESTDFAAHYARALNGVLFTQGDGQHISTLLALTFDTDGGVVYFGSGGHPPPLFLEASAKSRQTVQALATRNMVLGSMPEIEFRLASRKFAPGDVVLAHTDGLPLSPNIKVLRDFVGNGPGLAPDDALKQLYDRVWSAHASKTNQAPDDDVSIVCFTLRGARGDQKVG